MYQYRIQQLLVFETEKSEVVNLELEVLKMKIIIIFIDLLMATVLFFVGRFF
ncbi:LysR family transcriptional regulator, partial [Agathobacter rectalis]